MRMPAHIVADRPINGIEKCRFYVHADFRGKSIATALYTTLFELIKKQGYTNALIGITLPNDPSVSFHEKMGFEQIGVLSRCWI